MSLVAYVYSRGFYAQLIEDAIKPIILWAEGRVMDFCLRADQAGVIEGLTLGQALAKCPEARLYLFNPQQSFYWQEIVRQKARQVSPVVEMLSANEFYLAPPLPHDVYEAVSQISLPGHRLIIALAPGKRLARALGLWQRHIPGKGHTMLQMGSGSGTAANLLQKLPLQYISPCPQMTESLRRLGYGLAGEISSLPISFMANRFGEDGYVLARLCRGQDSQQPSDDCLDIRTGENLGEESGVWRDEAIHLALDGLAEKLGDSLEGRVCQVITLRILGERWEDRQSQRAAGRGMSPNDLRTCLGNLWIKLRSRGIPGPVMRVEGLAGGVGPSDQRQISLWGGSRGKGIFSDIMKSLLNSHLPLWVGERGHDRREQVLSYWDPLRFGE